MKNRFSRFLTKRVSDQWNSQLSNPKQIWRHSENFLENSLLLESLWLYSISLMWTIFLVPNIERIFITRAPIYYLYKFFDPANPIRTQDYTYIDIFQGGWCNSHWSDHMVDQSDIHWYLCVWMTFRIYGYQCLIWCNRIADN